MMPANVTRVSDAKGGKNVGLDSQRAGPGSVPPLLWRGPCSLAFIIAASLPSARPVHDIPKDRFLHWFPRPFQILLPDGIMPMKE